MSKRITTRWYIGAWIVWLIALVAMFAMSRGAQASSSAPPDAVVAYVVLAIAGIVTLVMWIGALIRLGQQRAWGWFAAVLVLHLVALGIVGMVAYAIAGPDDQTEVVMRPTVT
ncbi:MAG: hypothetical protein E6I11_13680 [Chloroflexi bacterium]|nr:MAG: hypothetical protein E6I11_13680 [Chloroflexota bacterium]TMG08642.1 MAG: hypothetical protein E6I00_16410 [Chloroflexota bacterium]